MLRSSRKVSLFSERLEPGFSDNFVLPVDWKILSVGKTAGDYVQLKIVYSY